MKLLSLLSIACCYFILAPINQQEITYASFLGTWEYDSPKGKTKLTYLFTPEKGFVRTIEQKDTELKAEGNFDVDKKGELYRLKLTMTAEGDKTLTQTDYYLIKFTDSSTVKLQLATDKQLNWLKETRKNTMVFKKKKKKDK